MVDRHLSRDDGEKAGAAEVVNVDDDEDAWTVSEPDDEDAVSQDNADVTELDAVNPYGLRHALSPAPVFGNVAVANSTDVQFGNKTFFNGPVTIRQVVYAADAQGIADSAVQHAASCVGPAEPGCDAVDVKVVGTTVVCNGTKANGSAAGAPDDPIAWWRRGWKDPNHRASLLCGMSLAVLFVGSGLVAVTFLYSSGGGSARNGSTGPELPGRWITPETNLTLSGKLRIIPRRDWLAQPARERQFIKTPVPYVIISHSASEGCNTQASCIAEVRNLQTFHIESRGWSDIAYNFMVGGDGYVYEGRGWDIMGAHAYGYNNRSTGLNVVGTFIYELPPERQLMSLRQLIELGVSEGHIAEDYKLLAHRQVSATESPGAALFKELQTWPHWSATP